MSIRSETRAEVLIYLRKRPGSTCPGRMYHTQKDDDSSWFKVAILIVSCWFGIRQDDCPIRAGAEACRVFRTDTGFSNGISHESADLLILSHPSMQYHG